MTSPPAANAESLAHGRHFVRNTVWNLLGLGLPLIAGLLAIPVLVTHLGTARFGVLTLAWMVIGYFSLFDLGLGRAVIKLAAERLGTGEGGEVPSLARTALTLMALLGMAAVPLIAILTGWLVRDVLHIPPELRRESLTAFYWMAFSVPFVINTTGLRGLMEAHQRFAQVNAVRVPMGIFNFLGPLAVLPFSTDLGVICAMLAAGRVIAWAVHLVLCRGLLGAGPLIDRRHVRPLLSLGGWMTVSSVVGPLMIYLDRFLIGAVLSVTAVAYYTTPFEVVSKLLIIPAALSGVLFPALSTTLAARPSEAARLLHRGTRHLYLSLFPIVLVIVALAREGLNLWLGAEFAANSARTLQWLAAGILVNGLAHAPLSLVHGAGRADLSARVHTVELLAYLPALWWALGRWGIEGAAAVWMLRAAVDAAAFFLIASRLLPRPKVEEPKRLGPRLIAVLGLSTVLSLVTATMLQGTWVKALFLVALLAGFFVFAWRRLIEPEERDQIRRILTQRTSRSEVRS